tara:strand:- start:1131 stop:1331 length:201 start_codon:yes stop_codon:yes gene_type:complete
MKKSKITDTINAIKMLHGINKSSIANSLDISRQLFKYHEDHDSFNDDQVDKISALVHSPQNIFTKG